MRCAADAIPRTAHHIVDIDVKLGLKKPIGLNDGCEVNIYIAFW